MMVEFLEFTLEGLSAGLIYAAIALSLVLIWRGTGVLNYSQGAMAMFTTYIGIEVIYHTHSYWAGFVVALAAGLVFGAAGFGLPPEVSPCQIKTPSTMSAAITSRTRSIVRAGLRFASVRRSWCRIPHAWRAPQIKVVCLVISMGQVSIPQESGLRWIAKSLPRIAMGGIWRG